MSMSLMHQFQYHPKAPRCHHLQVSKCIAKWCTGSCFYSFLLIDTCALTVTEVAVVGLAYGGLGLGSHCHSYVSFPVSP